MTHPDHYVNRIECALERNAKAQERIADTLERVVLGEDEIQGSIENVDKTLMRIADALEAANAAAQIKREEENRFEDVRQTRELYNGAGPPIK